MTLKMTLLAGTFLAATTLSPAFAQDTATTAADAASDSALQDIVVTARRRDESLQRVPVSVTALSAATLQQHSITNIANLAEVTPSLFISSSYYGVLGINIGIRGQRPNDVDLVQTPSIGVYIDDVYQSSTLGLGALGLDDAASVEVLKGPQGTLYGRNTTGGALKITTNLPDYTDSSATVRFGLGNGTGNRADVRGFGAVNAALVEDKVALRLVGSYQRNSGYGQDIATHTDIGNINQRAFHGVLRLKPADRLEITLRGDNLLAKSGGMLYTLTGVVPGGALNAVAAVQLGLPLTAPGLGQALTVLQRDYVNQPGRTRAYNGPLSQRVLQSTGSGTIRYEVNDTLVLKSITAYSYVKNNSSGDNDGTIFFTVDGNFQNQIIKQTTQELQASGQLFDRLDYTIGYFYYHLNGFEGAFANILTPLAGLQIQNNGKIYDTSHSGYAQASYKILPELRFTGGLRYTNESNRLVSRNQQLVGGVLSCNIPTTIRIGGACIARFQRRDTNWSYTAGLDWDAARDVLVYAKTSRGFKAGGFNERGSLSGGFNPFLPEQVTDYEIGAKTEFWDRRVRLNLAAYQSDYSNIQRTVLVAGTGGAPATAIQNAASAKIKGAELELTVRPVRALTLSAGGAYTDASYDSYSDPFTGRDLSNNVFTGVAKWQGSLSANYRQPVDFGEVSMTVDATYQSKVNYSPDNNLPPSAAFPAGTAAFTTQTGFILLNARIDAQIDGPDVKVSLWTRNLTNKKYFSGGFDYSSQLGFANMVRGTPRSIGIEFSKNF